MHGTVKLRPKPRDSTTKTTFGFFAGISGEDASFPKTHDVHNLPELLFGKLDNLAQLQDQRMGMLLSVQPV